jgi:hypothetical protein
MMRPRRDIALCPIQYSILDPDHADIICAISDLSPQLCIDDCIVLVDDEGELANPGLWRVASLEAIPAPSISDPDAFPTCLYRCVRVGKINDPSVVHMLT